MRKKEKKDNQKYRTVESTDVSCLCIRVRDGDMGEEIKREERKKGGEPSRWRGEDWNKERRKKSQSRSRKNTPFLPDYCC